VCGQISIGSPHLFFQYQGLGCCGGATPPLHLCGGGENPSYVPARECVLKLEGPDRALNWIVSAVAALVGSVSKADKYPRGFSCIESPTPRSPGEDPRVRRCRLSLSDPIAHRRTAKLPSTL
jgi:hypothetical protein